MSAVTVEVVYRGIFQKNLGQRIGRGIVLAAHLVPGHLGCLWSARPEDPSAPA